jgi:hypothetical protein
MSRVASAGTAARISADERQAGREQYPVAPPTTDRRFSGPNRETAGALAAVRGTIRRAARFLHALLTEQP